jgi:1-acyl-sn-glycerol-3-phosphate acyltransferase
MPIIPLAIAGAYEAWPRWRALPIPAPVFLPRASGRLAVSIGAPIDSRQLAEMPREQVLTRLFEEISHCKERAEQMRQRT